MLLKSKVIKILLCLFLLMITVILPNCITKSTQITESTQTKTESTQTKIVLVKTTTLLQAESIKTTPDNTLDSAFIPPTSSVSIEMTENMKSTLHNDTCITSPIEFYIEVDLSAQTLYLFCDNKNHKIVKIYPISTSKYGIGNQAGSNKTPLGWHRIE